MKNVKISIIIPVYKVENYINRCVESVINQLYKNLEIILVDDGSPDNCPKICDDWANKDSRIKVIHKQNGGLSDARNFGLQKATGEYITFLDSDDYFSSDFSTVCEYIGTEKYIDVFTSRIINDNSKHIYKFDKNGEKFTINYSFTACSRIYLMKFLKDNELFFKKGVYHEDVDFSLKVLLAKPNIKEFDCSYYNYTTDNNFSITREINYNTYYKRIVDVIEIIEDINNKYEQEILDNKPNYLKYISSVIYDSLCLIPKIKDKQLFDQITKFVNSHKILYKKTGSIRNLILKIMWSIFGLKLTMKLIRVIKKI